MKTMRLTALEAKCQEKDKRILDLVNMPKHNTAAIAHEAGKKAQILEDAAAERKRRKFHAEDLKEQKVPDDAMVNPELAKDKTSRKVEDTTIGKHEEAPPSQNGSEAGEHAAKIIKSNDGSQSES